MHAPEGSPLARRCATLGTLSLVLGLLEIAYCGQRIILQLLNSRLIAAERVLIPKPHGLSPAIYTEAHALAQRIAPWEIARTVPFLVASVVLLFLARRLRAGDLAALGAARQWAMAALGVVAVSLLVQIVAIVPPTMDYQARAVEMLPRASRAKAPFDIAQMTSSMTMIGTVLGLALGTVLVSAWPVVLYVWARGLERDASTAVESTGPDPGVGSTHEDHR